MGVDKRVVFATDAGVGVVAIEVRRGEAEAAVS
jgi:hypothetical protein